MNIRSKLLLSVGAVGTAAALVGSGTLATFSAQVTNPSNTFADGTLVLSDKVGSGTTCYSTGAGTSTDANVNTACDAAFNLTVKKPGDSTTGNLTLKDEGSLAATALKTFATTCTDSDASGETYHGTGSLCSKVQLYIQQYSDAQYTTPSVCLYGAATVPGTCDFSDTAKTLGAFATAYPSSTSALGLGAVSAGSSVYLKVGVKLPSTADNTVQGRKAAIDVSWMLEQ